jgi:MoaC family
MDLGAQILGPCPKSLAKRRSAAVGSLQRDQTAWRCFSQKNKGGTEHHEEFLKQMQELQAERDTLFGFTDDDRSGWSKSKGHQFDPSFLNEINQARDDHFSNDASSSLSVLADYGSGADSEETIKVQNSTILENDNSNNAGFAGLSHLSTDGTSIHMVHVGEKKVTSRVAVAQSKVILPDAVIKALVHDTRNVDLVGPKGPIFATAKVAGIMAAKYVVLPAQYLTEI